MKVILINNNHFITGGADSVYFNTGRILELNGVDVIYYSRNDEKNIYSKYASFYPLKIDYGKLSYFKKIKSIKSFIYNKQAKANLIELIDLYKPDVAHLHNYLGGLTNSVLDALKEKNIPTVMTIHDYRLICPAYTYFNKKDQICEKCEDKKYIRCFTNKCSLDGKYSSSLMLSIDAYYRYIISNPMKLIDQFIFVSKFSYYKHVKLHPYIIDKANIIYNTYKSNINSEIKKGNYLLYFGRLSKEKNIVTLINIVKKLNYRLIIAGKGPLEEKIRNIIQNSLIEYVGYKSGKDLEDLIRNCSFVVVPSIWYENNPMTIIEAFSFGKPVIGSKIGGITELLENERGILYEFNNENDLFNSIEKAIVISNQEYYKMHENIKKFYNEKISEEIYYKHLIDVYNKAIANNTNNKRDSKGKIYAR